ncbi:MAG: hypothetical protein KBI35_11030 [Ruminococcus sp.]|nr:hypothetical protein [Ruminococcus sp.]
MAKNGTEFSKYATAFFEIIVGAKIGKAIFVKDLLKMGLADEDKDYIDDIFPTVINSKGGNSVEKDKADMLRKYLRGDNDISDIVSQLETEFDLEFQQRYSEELQDYDESRIMAFARVLNIDVNEDDIDIASEAIAEYYSSIVIGSAIKKSRKGKKDKDEPESDRHKILLSYTLEESEKKALVKLCELTNEALYDLKDQTNKISDKQHELKNLTDSAENQRWKSYLLCDIDSLKERFDEGYPKLEKLCADLVKLLKNKKGIHKSLGTIITIASNIHSEEYKITCPDKFNYRIFLNMVTSFNDSYNHLLRDIDKL